MTLQPSELGTQDYWEKTYQTDLENLQTSGHVDETWFGQKSIDRLVKWISTNSQKHGLTTQSNILDIGTGNGALLFALESCGYVNLTGIDYSATAIELCKVQSTDSKVLFQVEDFLSEKSLDTLQFELCLDKGTYDAVALNPDDSASKRAAYRETLLRISAPGALYIITSCNFTRAELVQDFYQGFDLLDQIPTASFQFGGQTGNKETVLVFKRKSVT